MNKVYYSCCLKKNLNTSRPSEQQGEIVVSHIQRIFCQPEKKYFTRWPIPLVVCGTGEKISKTKMSGSASPRCSFGENKRAIDKNGSSRYLFGQKRVCLKTVAAESVVGRI